jgi:hypothetical protein
MTGLGRRRLMYGVTAGAALALSRDLIPGRASAAVPGPSGRGWVNVRDYGASGTGGTDDTAAIKAAITAATGTAAPATHDRVPVAGVYLPPGIYRVTSDLLIQSVEGFAFTGAGAELTMVLASGKGFKTAVLNVDGSAWGSFGGFSIAGDGTEGSGNAALPNAINLTWTTGARRSTTGNTFSDIYVRGLKFACGVRVAAPPGTTRQVDGSTISNVTVSGAGLANSAYGALYRHGFYFGNGSTGNQYNHVVYNSSVSQCRAAVYCDASGFEWYGGQPAQNAIDFSFSGAPAQTTIQGIQSQDSGQFLKVVGGAATATASVRDVLFTSAYLAASRRWIEVTGIARGWEFSNLRACIQGARPVIFFSGSGEVEVATLINVAQQNTAAAGVVVDSGGSVKLVNYMQLDDAAEVVAVCHDFTVTVRSAYACTQSDRYVLADASAGAFTVTLPNAFHCPGKAYTVKKTDASAHAVTVLVAAGQTIDGAAACRLATRNSAVDVVSDGRAWFITGRL